MSEPLTPDAHAFIVLQREYRGQMDEHASLRREAERVRSHMDRIEADALTCSERASSILETMLKLQQDAIATEARRAETVKLDSVHEGAGPKDIAQGTHLSHQGSASK